MKTSSTHSSEYWWNQFKPIRSIRQVGTQSRGEEFHRHDYEYTPDENVHNMPALRSPCSHNTSNGALLSFTF